MKRATVILACVTVSAACFGARCKKCSGSGFVSKFITCECCNGEKTVNPERLGKSAGIARWTETTYWTGVTTESNYRIKRYSQNPCPVCKSSAKKGMTRVKISCEACEGTGIEEPISAIDVKRMSSVVGAQISVLKKNLDYLQRALKKNQTNDVIKETIGETKDKIKKREAFSKKIAESTKDSSSDLDGLRSELAKLAVELDKEMKWQRYTEMILDVGITPYEMWINKKGD